MSYLAIAFTVVFSYLFGSLNSAILVCKAWKHKDIRDYGSNNAGLTNVLRVFGKGPALATLVFDLVKGVAAVIICRIVVTDVMGVTFFGEDLSINVLPWTPHEIENAAHAYELPQVHYTVVRVALGQMGIGGDDTWGARTHPEYLLPAEKDLSLTFCFRGM